MYISYHLDYESIVHSRSELVHLAVLFRAAKQGPRPSSSFAFGLVLDTSSSMVGQPLERAKLAAQMVITHLGAEDLISVVTFSDGARTIIPLQPATDKAYLKALIQIRQIVAHGLERERVRTSCLGFGDGYNEDLLNELSKAAGGTLHDADSPEKFPSIFQQELDSLLKLSAKNVRVRLRQLHYCTGVAVISDYPAVSLPEGGLELSVGDLVSEEERVLVFALEVLPIPSLGEGRPAASLEGEALLEVEILYDVITSDGVTSTKEERTIRVLPVQSETDVRVNETVIKWVAEQMAGQAISDAIAARRPG